LSPSELTEETSSCRTMTMQFGLCVP
jgi:hypothetical protein